jgi:hypothetical protein
LDAHLIRDARVTERIVRSMAKDFLLVDFLRLFNRRGYNRRKIASVLHAPIVHAQNNIIERTDVERALHQCLVYTSPLIGHMKFYSGKL